MTGIKRQAYLSAASSAGRLAIISAALYKTIAMQAVLQNNK